MPHRHRARSTIPSACVRKRKNKITKGGASEVRVLRHAQDSTRCARARPPPPMVWSVYEASFTTTAGESRYYIGCCCDPEERALSLQGVWGYRRGQPRWCKDGTEDFEMKLLMDDVPSKYAAVAAEALFAARRYRRCPLTRGGAWCRARLSARDEEELLEVSRCAGLKELFAYAAGLEKGSLFCHMRHLKFRSTLRNQIGFTCGLGHAPSGAALRAVYRSRSGTPSRGSPGRRQGLPGHTYRVRKNIKYGDDRYAPLKLGGQPAQAKARHQRNWKAKS